MPSPLNGLMAPEASPATSHVGPAEGCTDPPIGSRPPVGGPTAVSGRISHEGGAIETKASIRWDVLIDFQALNVDNSPTPTLTVPSPTGKIQPYPGRAAPLRSRRSRWLSIHGSAWRGERK